VVAIAVGDQRRAAREHGEAGGKEEPRLARAPRAERRRQKFRRLVAGERAKDQENREFPRHASGLPRAEGTAGQDDFSTCNLEKSASGEKSSCSARKSASRLSRWAGSGSITITSSKNLSTSGRSAASASYAAR